MQALQLLRETSGGPAMTLTEEQRAALKRVVAYMDEMYAIASPYHGCTEDANILRAMIDSSEQFSDATKLIGFDLEKARASIAHYRIENPSNVDTESALKELVDQANLAEDALAEIERLRSAIRTYREREESAFSEIEMKDEFLTRQNARINELEADLEQSERVIEARLEVIDQQATQIRELQAEGKIGPDDSKKISHLRPYEVVAADLAGMLAKSWQITDERKAAIQWAEEMAGDCKAGDVLRDMLAEVTR
jgi:small-conductance mechanosensitive channel